MKSILVFPLCFVAVFGFPQIDDTQRLQDTRRRLQKLSLQLVEDRDDDDHERRSRDEDNRHGERLLAKHFEWRNRDERDMRDKTHVRTRTDNDQTPNDVDEKLTMRMDEDVAPDDEDEKMVMRTNDGHYMDAYDRQMNRDDRDQADMRNYNHNRGDVAMANLDRYTYGYNYGQNRAQNHYDNMNRGSPWYYQSNGAYRGVDYANDMYRLMCNTNNRDRAYQMMDHQ